MAFFNSNIVLLMNENVNVNVKGLPIKIVVLHFSVSFAKTKIDGLALARGTTTSYCAQLHLTLL